jgi:glycopeptide antibiotics resistance protein
MVVIGGRYLLIAFAVFVGWRLICWRRNGATRLREGVVFLLFLWSLVGAWLTFFPMNIIFYSWHGSFSLVPLSSTIRLFQQADLRRALMNTVGNVLLFVPFGVLLPLLFAKLRRVWPLAWRVAVISSAIEVLQIPTKVRATDVDDVMLNVVGALVGLGIFRVILALGRRYRRPRALLERVGSGTRREPLLVGLVPVAISTVLIVAAMVPSLIWNTLSERDIVRDATSGQSQRSVVARADVGGHAFLLVGGDDSAFRALQIAAYKRVLPGRYVLTMRGSSGRGEGSGYSWSVTTFDPTAGEVPVLYVWGRNESAAAWLVARGNGGAPEQKIAVGEYFMVAFPISVDFLDGIGSDQAISLLDGAGRDVTQRFAVW